jgi:UDP-N-acetylmuramate dehydrogenase
VLFLGGGSNLVVRDSGFPGLVIQLGIDKVSVNKTSARDRDALVVASAGVVWDDFVAQIIGAGYTGLECLSGIPGLVGATPMQNVGAYGQEVSETIQFVRALDRESGTSSRSTAGCAFGYRGSRFRGSDRTSSSRSASR